MATYQFSALADDQAISFNPNTDVLNFDQSFLNAAGVRFVSEGANVRIGLQGGKDVVLLNITPLQLATTNITFADGSRLLVGDNTTGTANDNLGNVLNGTSGHDLLDGLGGADTMNGGLGNDVYFVTAGDVISDSGGTDTVVTAISWNMLTSSGVENLTIVGTSNTDTEGNNFNNFITGNDANNYVNARGGTDTILGGGGNDYFNMSMGGTTSFGFDWIDGGAGIDTVDFGANAQSGLVVDLDTGSIAGGEAGGAGAMTAINIEKFIAGNFSDHVRGNSAANNLYGGAGNDTLIGLAGNDSLVGADGNDQLQGGTGFDTLLGGAGADQFLFAEAAGSANADRVSDFVSGTDELVFDNTVLTALGSSGAWAAGDGRFFAAAGATSGHDANDRLIYNTSNGNLYYDPDGLGGTAGQIVATLVNLPALTAADITVVGGTPGGVFNGTAGDDTIIGTAGNDTINGLGGNDWLMGLDGNDSVSGGDGNDSLIGGNDNPHMSGNAFSDTLNGGLGDDNYYVRGGEILIDAGGVDTVNTNVDWTLGAGFENLRVEGDGNLVVHGNDLANVMDIAAHGTDDTGTARDTAFGGAGNDTFTGFQHADIFGEAGDDVIYASHGRTMTGGAGADHFILREGMAEFPEREAIIITDFASGVDKIHVTLPIFGPQGNFTPGDGRFYAAPGATAAHDADDRIIYDTSTGVLYYDDPFSDSVFALARLQGAPTVVATDIYSGDVATPGATINGTAGNDSLVGTDGDDTINGFGGNDTLTGMDGADLLVGGDGNDRLVSVVGPHGDHFIDTLDGGFGDDRYEVNDDGDIILSDPGGIDTVSALNANWTLGAGLENLDLDDTVGSAFTGIGNELNNVIRGASEGASLFGMGGDDTLVIRSSFNHAFASGGDGNDTLMAGRDSDLQGDAGNDVLVAGFPSGQTTMTGGTGADSFVFRSFVNEITDFVSGVDKIRLDATVMPALGTSGNFSAGDERFHAGATAAEADDRVIYNAATGELWYDADGSGSGAAGLIATLQAGATLVATDIAVDNGTAPGGTINGTAGNDSLTGTSGDDTINGLAGNDTLRGLGGDDRLDGGDGTDSLDGGLGNDTYLVSSGDVITDAGGTDTVITAISWNMLTSSGVEDMVIVGTSATSTEGNNFNNQIIGNVANNYVNARAGSDSVLGDAGNDTFNMSMGGTSSFGNDSIDGGIGIDTVDFGANPVSGLVADLEAGTVTGGEAGGAGSSFILNIENFIAGNFADSVSGNAAANRLFGNAGNDTLIGMAGNDSLVGGDGNDRLQGGTGFDTLQGGAGIDAFVFADAAGSANADRVSDFASGTDELMFDNSVLTALGADGAWASGDGRFHAAAGATAAHDSNDRLVYNTTNGNLYYDADGIGGAAAQIVATLGNLSALSAADITVI